MELEQAIAGNAGQNQSETFSLWHQHGVIGAQRAVSTQLYDMFVGAASDAMTYMQDKRLSAVAKQGQLCSKAPAPCWILVNMRGYQACIVGMLAVKNFKGIVQSRLFLCT